MSQSTDYVELSQRFLDTVRRGENGDPFALRLERIPATELRDRLSDDASRMAFWINTYHAWLQYELRRNPGRYRFHYLFFVRRFVRICGKRLSLNHIENGMLRHSRPLLGMGYLKNPLASQLERWLRVLTPDPRVHFALNCGAQSCPPIRFYAAETLEEQLELATRAYLEQEAEYDPSANRVVAPLMFKGFPGDFGGRAGTLAFLERYGVLPAGKALKLSFKSWNWGMHLDNFDEG